MVLVFLAAPQDGSTMPFAQIGALLWAWMFTPDEGIPSTPDPRAVE
jgi:hypothetical protein